MIEHDYTVLDFIKGGLFLIWFLGSMAAIFVVLIKYGPWLTISVFGQIFFVIGLMVLYSGIKNHNFQPAFLIFLYVGLLAIVFGLLLHFGSDTLKESLGNYIAYAGISIFFFMGASLIITYFVRTSREKNCTELVRAFCIDIKKRRRDTAHMSQQNVVERNRYHYCPVFSFSYMGKPYEVCTNFFTTYISVELGKEYNLYINPKYPTCFKEEGESARQSSIEIILGIFFTLVSTLAFFVVFFLS